MERGKGKIGDMRPEQKRDLEVYVHIPFCVRKCAYCDFLSFPVKDEVRERYLDALKGEIASFPHSGEYRVATVFFGGGTPSVLTGEQIAAVLERLREKFAFAKDAEITIECNPGTADKEKLERWRAAGINRLSLGLQSADNAELSLLGRIHTWEDFEETYALARAAGFSNINVDLMSALPGQSEASWERTLRSVLALAPEHISAYSLIVEEGTPFYERYHSDDERRERGETPRFLPSEETERVMYEQTKELLGAAGLRRYEISNYARPGFACRHNVGYWRGAEYVGFGLGASSLLRESGARAAFACAEAAPEANSVRPGISGGSEPACAENASEAAGVRSGTSGSGAPACTEAAPEPVYVRLRNPARLESYLAGDFSGRERDVLTREDRMAEFMFLGLRMTDGVSEAEFAARFGTEIDAIYGDVLRRQISLKLLKRSGGRIFLTMRGIDVSNAVMAEFLL